MRTPNGFDRMSTEEELSQVLAVLQEFSPNGWMLSAESSADLQADALWSDTVLDDPDEAECLAELMARRPELKN